MGTSGAYTGAGGKAGKEISEGLGDWFDSFPGGSDGGDDRPNSDGTEGAEKPVELNRYAVGGAAFQAVSDSIER